MNTDLKTVTDLFMHTVDPRLQRGFSEIIQFLVTTKSCIMSEWARNAYNFEAFIKKCYRFFKNERINWKINAAILQFILPRFNHKKYIPVPIDSSFVPNNMLGSYAKTRSDQEKAKKGFFIFSAALPVRGRGTGGLEVYQNGRLVGVPGPFLKYPTRFSKAHSFQTI